MPAKKEKRAKSPQFIFGVPGKDVYVLDVKRKPNSGFLGRMIQFVDTHWSFSVSLLHTHTHPRTHSHTHTHTRTNSHTLTRSLPLSHVTQVRSERVSSFKDLLKKPKAQIVLKKSFAFSWEKSDRTVARLQGLQNGRNFEINGCITCQPLLRTKYRSSLRKCNIVSYAAFTSSRILKDFKPSWKLDRLSNDFIIQTVKLFMIPLCNQIEF